MTKPNDPNGGDFRATLPAELQSLDRELSGIGIEERPSFAPELEGELARAWREGFPPEAGERRPWARLLWAAGLAGLMITGVAVPSARAAVFNLVRTVAEEAFPSLFEEPEVEAPLPEIQVQNPPGVDPEAMGNLVVSPVDASNEAEPSELDLPMLPPVEFTFPEIVSRQEAARIIASYYPRELQDAGVEGTVKVTFWLDAQGRPENIQIGSSSGNRQLDYQAMLALRDIRFRPATRNGVGVGTWVEVGIRFFALTGMGIIGSDSAASSS